MARASIEILENGYVLPLTFIESASATTLGRFDGSVHYRDGAMCDLGKVGLPRHTYQPATIDDSRISIVAGSHIFGGILHNEHFGHFVTESLVRLWAKPHLHSDFSNFVFYKRNVAGPVANFVTEFFSLLVPNSSIEILSAPTRFDVLAVPQELKEGSYIYGHDEARSMMKRLKASSAGAGPRKLFVSRSKLKRGQGGIAGEHLLDEYLTLEGYTVIYPETLSVREQIDLYTGAEQL